MMRGTMRTKATRDRDPLVLALRASAARARTTAGHELALGRSRSGEAYSQVAEWLTLLACAVGDGQPTDWSAPRWGEGGAADVLVGPALGGRRVTNPSKELREVLKLADRLGYTLVRDRRHIVLRSPIGKLVAISRSPGGGRAVPHMIAQLHRGCKPS